MTRKHFRFLDREVANIAGAAPANSIPSRLKLLPQILDHWALYDLSSHLSRETGSEIASRRLRFDAVVRDACDLKTALKNLRGRDKGELALRTLGWPRRDALVDLKASEILAAEKELAALINSVGKLSSATLDDVSKKRGRPANLTAYLVMLDVQAIYEYLTGQRATRRVRNQHHPDKGKDYGPFWHFSSQVWREVFKTSSDLPAAMRNWAVYVRRYKDRSPLIANIYFQHPEWRKFYK